MAASNYDDKNITTLDWVEHIRKRPGMYIGDIGNGSGYHDCVYILMKERPCATTGAASRSARSWSA